MAAHLREQQLAACFPGTSLFAPRPDRRALGAENPPVRFDKGKARAAIYLTRIPSPTSRTRSEKRRFSGTFKSQVTYFERSIFQKRL
jgi:hypothetical protein